MWKNGGGGNWRGVRREGGEGKRWEGKMWEGPGKEGAGLGGGEEI